MIKELLNRDYTHLEMYEPSPQEVFYSEDNVDRKRPLRITFVMGKTSVCGGAKIIFQQANLLQDQGFDVSIVAYHKKPTWYPLNVKYIKAPPGLALHYAIHDCDIIVATYYTQIKGCIETGIAPVVYFEQGDTHIYRYNEYTKEQQAYIKGEITSVPFVLTVSKALARELNELFHVRAEVIHNAIDHEIFKLTQEVEPEEEYVLMMGEGQLYYKGIANVIEAFKEVKSKYRDMKLYWVTSKEPDGALASEVDKVFISPSQEDIADLYRSAKVYVSGSYYESFALPIIEAMACGCPVVAVQNMGLLDYALNESNILLVPPNQPKIMAEKLKEILEDERLQNSLVSQGLSTIKDYLWKNTIIKYGKFYQSISYYKNVGINKMEDWNLHIELDSLLENKDILKLKKFMLYTGCQQVWSVKVVKTRWGVVGYWQPIATKKYYPLQTMTKGYCYVAVRGNKKDQEKVRSMEQELRAKKVFESMTVERQKAIEIIKLVEEGHIELSKESMETLLVDHKQCSELWLLYGYILSRLGHQELQEIKAYIEVLGDFVIEDVFIYDVEGWFESIGKGASNEMEAVGTRRKEKEVYYFADKLYEYGLYKDAALYYEQFILGKEGEIETRIGACRRKALCHYFLKEYESVRENCFRAFQYALPRAEECYLVGLSFQEEEEWELGIHWFDLATTCRRPKEGAPYHNEDDWGFNPFLAQCICYYELGQIDKAIYYNEQAAKVKPFNETILYNRDYFDSL